MKGIAKQQTGFRFGKYRLKVIKEVGCVSFNKRKYKLVVVETNNGEIYMSIRLYNESGKFIKQLLFEPGVVSELIKVLQEFNSVAEKSPCEGWGMKEGGK